MLDLPPRQPDLFYFRSFFLFCNSSLGKSGHFQYFWSIFIFHLLGASAHNFCIQDVSTSYFHWFSHPLFLYHPRCYCHLNEKLLYHWVSCPLGYQYETVSQMGEWYILLEYLDWGQGYILFSWRSYHIQRFLLLTYYHSKCDVTMEWRSYNGNFDSQCT